MQKLVCMGTSRTLGICWDSKIDSLLVSQATHLPLNELLMQDFRSQVDDYSQNDDVFRVEFLANIIFIGVCPSAIALEKDVRSLLKGWNSSFTVASLDQFSSPPPPPGPYLARGHFLWQVRILYDDVNQTFLTACQPAQDGTS